MDPSVFTAIAFAVCALHSFAEDTIPASLNDKTANEREWPNNLTSFYGKNVTFDIQDRFRWENRSNNVDFNSAARAVTDGNWCLNRFRIGLTVEPTAWLKLYAQAQDSREFNGRRPLIPGASAAEGDDAFDLRQAFIEIGNSDRCPWRLKIGRQELAYGDERLVGASDWTNFARTFDAATLTYNGHGFSLDVFSSTPVVITATNTTNPIFSTETKRIAISSSADFMQRLTHCLLGLWTSIRSCSMKQTGIRQTLRDC